MEERAYGIIVRTRPLTETSLIVHLLARDQGRIALVAKGARRPKSPFSGKLDLFYATDISFARSRTSDLHNLREVILRDAHAALRKDLSRLNAAAYCVVLVEQATETETPIPEFYDWVEQVLGFLDQHSPKAGFAFSLEQKFLEIFGAAPSVEALSPGARRVSSALAELPLEAADQLPLDPGLKRELDSFLRRAIGTALERLPPQRERFLSGLGA